MGKTKTHKPTGYDMYTDYKTFSIAAGGFVVLLLVPAPDSMVDVGVEYAVAIIFGRLLDQTGAAYWLVRSVVGAVAGLGLESGSYGAVGVKCGGTR